VALLLGIATILVAAPSFAQEAKNAQEAKKKYVEKKFSPRTYPGSLWRKYAIHLPSNYQPTEKPLPLVMVLHGCLETGGESGSLPFESIERDSKFDDLADRERFIVVYPNHEFEKIGLNNCWDWWVDADIHKGSGEVADLAGIVDEVQKDYKNVDPNRIYIAGLSSGAAMTVAVLVAYSDKFAAGSPTAGLPYSETLQNFMQHAYKPVDDIAAAMNAEMGANKRPVPIFIIQSKDDETVNFHYAENIRDSWGKAFGVDTTKPSSSESGETNGTPWTHEKYKGPDGNTVVETLFLTGLKHGWYGDGQGTWAFPNAPDTAQLAWDFFKAHPRPAPASSPR